MRQTGSPGISLYQCVHRFFPINTLMDLVTGGSGGLAWENNSLAVILEDDNIYSSYENLVLWVRIFY
jgi:hypothetical protein